MRATVPDLALRAAAPERADASVIVVNYNGGALLKACLASLLRACRETDEIILVDNASTDGSLIGIEHAFPRVRLVRSEVNRGFGAANNLGAGLATGQYLAFLNPDAIAEPGWLSALIAALAADPRAGLATSKILLLHDPTRINTCGNDLHVTGLATCRGLGLPQDALTDCTEVGAVSGAAFAIRRDLFHQLGGFDDEFFLYVEDTDLSWRARLAGYRCLSVPTSVAYHKYRLRFGPRKVFYQERNRYCMLLKVLRWRTLVVLLPALLLAEVVTWGAILVCERGQLMGKLRAYGWVLRHWRELLARRRQTQALRRVRDREMLAACTYRLAYEYVDQGIAGRVARWVFDPAFFMLHRLALAVIRW